MAEDRLQILIEAVNQTEKAFGEVKTSLNDLDKKASDATSTMSDKIANSFNSLKEKAVGAFNFIKQHWLAVTAAIAGATITIKKAWDLAMQAAKDQQAMEAFRIMANRMGEDADALLKKFKEMSRGLMSEDDIIAFANRMQSMGVPMNSLGELMVVAQAKAREMGLGFGEALEGIISGITRTSDRMLRNVGIVIDTESAYKQYAQSVGKATTDLTEQEQQLAILNAVLGTTKGSIDEQGLSLLTTAEKAQKFGASVENLKSKIGESLLPALETLLPVLEEVAKVAGGIGVVITGLIGTFQGFAGVVSDALAIITRPMAGIENILRSLGITSSTFFENLSDSFKETSNELLSEAGQTFKKAGEIAKQTTDEIKKDFGSIQDEIVQPARKGIPLTEDERRRTEQTRTPVIEPQLETEQPKTEWQKLMDAFDKQPMIKPQLDTESLNNEISKLQTLVEPLNIPISADTEVLQESISLSSIKITPSFDTSSLQASLNDVLLNVKFELPKQRLDIFVSAERGADDFLAELFLEKVSIRAQSEGLQILTTGTPA